MASSHDFFKTSLAPKEKDLILKLIDSNSSNNGVCKIFALKSHDNDGYGLQTLDSEIFPS